VEVSFDFPFSGLGPKVFLHGERNASMSRIRLRGRSAAARARTRRLPPSLEILEDRCLLDAASVGVLGSQDYASSDILVRLRPEFSSGTQLTLIANESGSPSLIASGLWKIELAPSVTVAAALASFRLDSRVEFAQPDYKIAVQTTPNDPYFTSNLQWGLNEIGAQTAWNHTTGSSNVIVAIIDSGIDYTHPDLAGNIWNNPSTVGDGIGNDIHGANFTSLTTTTGNSLDDNGHGTHVAGIIGAVGNNGTGVSGVDWHVQLMALKFLDANGSGYTSGAVRAIDFAIAHHASIINASWGGGGFDQALSDAIGRARQAGIIFVTAAGNNGTNNDTTPFYPADYNSDNVVTVAASNSSDHPAGFTDYGPHSVDLYAPGVGIWSTVLNGQYASYSGTSMATPFVTGALALLKAEHPDWNYHQLIARLQATVDKLPQYGNVAWGGRLDLAAALADVAPTPPPVNSVHPAITGTIASKPGLGQFYRVRVIFNEAVDPNSFTTADVALTGPNGSVGISGVKAVVGTGNTQFDITFAPQTAPGTYQLTVGPHIQDADGHEMAQAFTASFTVRGTSASFSSSSGALNFAIRDFHTTTSTINVGQDMAIGKLTVSVNITHSWVGDLVIKLRGPDGTTVTLFNRRGGSGHNLATTFDDAASRALSNARAPYTGAVRPESALSAVSGKSTRGSWQLIVQDQAAGNEGTLTGWSLSFQPGPASQSARSEAIEEDAAPAVGIPGPTTVADALFARSLVSFLSDTAKPIGGSLPARVADAMVQATASSQQTAATHVLAVDRVLAAERGGSSSDVEIAWDGIGFDESLDLAEL
jgi:subtilisin family serine protease/subtilisin-like proprotein convertase family protein